MGMHSRLAAYGLIAVGLIAVPLPIIPGWALVAAGIYRLRRLAPDKTEAASKDSATNDPAANDERNAA